MLGAQYHRLVQDKTKEEVAAALKISAPLLTRIEHDVQTRHKASLYLDLSKIYHVSVDDLIKEYPDELIRKRNAKPKQQKPKNCIGCYMCSKNHTLRSMAALLGVSHESIRKLCAKADADLPEEEIKKIANLEDISTENFMKLFGKA